MVVSTDTRKLVTRNDARSLGQTYYYTGIPCKRGHIAKRWTCNSACAECQLQQTSAWIRRNSKRRQEQQRAWREDNQDYSATWRETHKERLQELAIAWCAANPDKVREKGRKWRLANPDRQRAHVRAWYRANGGGVRLR